MKQKKKLPVRPQVLLDMDIWSYFDKQSFKTGEPLKVLINNVLRGLIKK